MDNEEIVWEIIIQANGQTLKTHRIKPSNDEITIGRMPAEDGGENHVSIDEPMADPKHVRLVLNIKQATIKKDESINGTILNGRILDDTVDTDLQLDQPSVIEIERITITLKLNGVDFAVNESTGEPLMRQRPTIELPPGFDFNLRDGTQGDKEIIGRGQYVQLLPEIFQPTLASNQIEGSTFIAKYLLAFEAMWTPIEWHSQNFPLMLDAGSCPEEMLPWLSSWNGLHEISEEWEPEWQRKLLKKGHKLVPMWGTADMLQETLELYFKYERPEPKNVETFDEFGDGIATEIEAKFEQHTRVEIDEESGAPFEFEVTIRVGDGMTAAQERVVWRIINLIKPAHTVCTRVNTVDHVRGGIG